MLQHLKMRGGGTKNFWSKKYFFINDVKKYKKWKKIIKKKYVKKYII